MRFCERNVDYTLVQLLSVLVTVAVQLCILLPPLSGSGSEKDQVACPVQRERLAVFHQQSGTNTRDASSVDSPPRSQQQGANHHSDASQGAAPVEFRGR